ncbi:MAG: hypothetical protein QXT77_08010 [Candidatus Methanomethylicaceae archaeon]
MKRFRKAIEPLRVRFYAVGEYGDQSERPHYHVAVFGYPRCSRGRTFYRPGGDDVDAPSCCEHCRLVHSSWSYGRVFIGDLTTESAQYIAGYVTKKMTRKDDIRLHGRYPEFARMSLRPGIGADAMHDVASTLLEFNLDELQTDVPSGLRHGGRVLPLGRYLRGKLREAIGRDKRAPQATLDEMDARLQELREEARRSDTSLKKLAIQKSKAKVASLEARNRIFKKRGSI